MRIRPGPNPAPRSPLGELAGPASGLTASRGKLSILASAPQDRDGDEHGRQRHPRRTSGERHSDKKTSDKKEQGGQAFERSQGRPGETLAGPLPGFHGLVHGTAVHQPLLRPQAVPRGHRRQHGPCARPQGRGRPDRRRTQDHGRGPGTGPDRPGSGHGSLPSLRRGHPHGGGAHPERTHRRLG